jgi:hypothetical protein
MRRNTIAALRLFEREAYAATYGYLPAQIEYPDMRRNLIDFEYTPSMDDFLCALDGRLPVRPPGDFFFSSHQIRARPVVFGYPRSQLLFRLRLPYPYILK